MSDTAPLPSSPHRKVDTTVPPSSSTTTTGGVADETSFAEVYNNGSNDEASSSSPTATADGGKAEGAGGGGSGVVGSLGAAASSVVGSVASGVRGAYSAAPDLGVTSALSRLTGLGAPAAAEGGKDTTATSHNDADDGDKSSPANQKGKQDNDADDDDKADEEEHRRGPSNVDRVDQPQTAVGTEYGIPTSAGEGTTLSPDESVRPAAERERQLASPTEVGGKSKAVVGQDYRRDERCPTTSSSSTPAADDDDDDDEKGANDEGGRQSGSSAGEKTLVDSNSSHSNSSSRSSLSSSPSRENGEAGDQAGEGEKKERRHCRSFATKMKDKLRGNAQVLSGRIKKDEDAVLEGKARAQGVDKTEIVV